MSSANASSASLVSCRHTTSGRRSSSQGSSRGTRCLSELTFQVTMRTDPSLSAAPRVTFCNHLPMGWGIRCAAVTAALFAAIVTPAAAALKIDVLSNRADLVSGGDALVAISRPARVYRNGTEVTKGFARRSDGRFEGLVTGLRDGANTLRAQRPDGSGGKLTVTNHPIGGPVFSGPQIQPWV